MRSTFSGCMLCGSTGRVAAAISPGVRLNYGYSSRWVAMGEGVDEDGGFVAILQGIGQVEAANPEVDDAGLGG